MRRIYAKTGALFVLAAKASGVLAAAGDEVLGHLHTYGRELGIAFQIVDDLLDVVGSESQVGKPLGSDLAQGLVTLPVICFLEQYPSDDRILSALYGVSKAEQVPVALEAIRNSEAIKQTRDEALRHVTRAREAMLNLPDNRFRQAGLKMP